MILEERSSCGGSLGMIHDVKNGEEGPLSWGLCKNLNFKFLIIRIWEEKIN